MKKSFNFTALQNRNHWARFLYTLLFALVFWFFIPVSLIILAIVQFIHVSLVGKQHTMIREISNSLCAFCYQVVLYMTFNSDDIPFPFSQWPSS